MSARAEFIVAVASFMLAESVVQASSSDWLDDPAGADAAGVDAAGADVGAVDGPAQPASSTRPATTASLTRTGMGTVFSCEAHVDWQCRL
jgi:hypothetical protein